MAATHTAPAAVPVSAPSASSAHPGIPFARLIRVEWGKATDTRSARWLLAIVALVMAATMLVPTLDEHGTDQTYDTYLGWPLFAASTLLPIVAILAVTTEWTQRTVLTTFTQEPRRGRVLGAKIAVSMLLALAGTVFSAALTVIGVPVVEVSGRHVVNDLTTGQMIGAVLFLALVTLKGVALATLLANSAAAIVLFFVFPIAFAMLTGVLGGAGPWLDTTQTFDWVQTADWSGHIGKIVVSTLVWVVAPLVVGLVVTLRREVK